MRIKIDMRQVERYKDTLHRANAKALPYAHKATLNGMAFKATQLAKDHVKKEMVVRNQWTLGSIMFERARGTQTRRMASAFGSVQPYMETQEFGGVETGGGKHGVAIPTNYSAFLPRGARPRTKVSAKSRARRTLRLDRKKRAAKNRKQALVFKVQDAVRSGRRDIFHDFGGGKKKGLFRVVGGSKKRKVKRGWPSGASLEMTHDLSENSIQLKPNPWMRPAAKALAPNVAGIYRKAVLHQLRRIRLA